jgi:uncharacterized protein (TIRG00374 family)
MNQRTKKSLLFIVRWGIAIVGIWWVVSQMSLRDTVLLTAPESLIPERARLAEHADEDARSFKIIDPATGETVEVDGERVINPAAAKDKPLPVKIYNGTDEQNADLLGVRLAGEINAPWVKELLVLPEKASQAKWIFPTEVVGGYQLDVPRQRVEVGITHMVQQANPWMLMLALAVFPVTFMVTSVRWDMLLRAIDVRIGLWRVFEINMVGAFYNTFMPGSVGGDVFKMYYASKQTPHRIRAIVSVIIDRIIGLIALVMLGGAMAAYQYAASENKADPTARACMQVALAAVAILVGCVVGMAVMFQPGIRKALGVEFLLAKLPMQKHIEHVREVTRIYRRRPVMMLMMLLITMPVHITVVISAMIAGHALGLPIKPIFYFTAVPVIVLVGSIPISPQGAGVMEVFAYMLTRQQGASISEAVALTMSIRLVQILWNLTGGIFVLKGGYHAPTESEQKEMDNPGEPTGAGDGPG